MQRSLAAMLIIATIVGSLFVGAAAVYFSIDDFWWLYDGRFVMATPGGWHDAFFANNGAGPYRPLTQNVFFFIGWHLFGLHPLGYHLICLVALIASACIAYRYFSVIFDSSFAALLAALVFGVSATHYESVSWVSAFSETGAVLAFLVALNAAIRANMLLASGAYLVALLCNETTTPLPLIALAGSVLILRMPVRRALVQTLPLWAIFSGYAIFRIVVTGLPEHDTGPFAFQVNLGLYGRLILRSIVDCTLLLPHGHNILAPSGPGIFAVLTKGCAVLWVVSLGALVFFALRSSNRQRVQRTVFFGAIVFVAGLAPLLLFSANNWSLYNLSIPLIGFAVIAGALFAATEQRGRTGIALLGTAAAIVLNAVVIYAPGGLEMIDPLNQFATAAAQLDRDISLRLASAQHPLAIDIVSADNLRDVKIIAGDAYVLALLTGDTSQSVHYLNQPVASADVTYEWDARAMRFYAR